MNRAISSTSLKYYSRYVLLLTLVAIALPIKAYNQWEWRVSQLAGKTFQTQSAAEQALWGINLKTSALKDKVVKTITLEEVYYRYTAPPMPPVASDWLYRDASGTSYGSEAEVAKAIAASFTHAVCGPPSSVTPAGEWQTTGAFLNVPRNQLRYYDVVYWGYSQYASPQCWEIASPNGGLAYRSREVACPQPYDSWNSTDCLLNTAAYIIGRPLVCSAAEGNPCDPTTGDKHQTETDYDADLLVFRRHYHSMVDVSDTSMGNHWTHTLNARVVMEGGIPNALIRPSGFQEPLRPLIAGQSYGSTTSSGIEVHKVGVEWELYLPDGRREVYDSRGQLLAFVDAGGRATALSYNNNGQPEKITNPFGLSVSLAYDRKTGNLDSLVTPNGKVIRYRYDEQGNLIAVDSPIGTNRVYHYENSSFPGHLTGITDERGIRYSTFRYDYLGRAILSEHANSVGRRSFIYQLDGTTMVADGEGHSRTYSFTTDQAFRKVTAVSFGGATLMRDYKTVSEDQFRKVRSVTDLGGAKTVYSYDGLQPASRTEAAGTAESRLTVYTYDPRFHRKPTTVTAPSVFTP